MTRLVNSNIIEVRIYETLQLLVPGQSTVPVIKTMLRYS